MILRHILRSLVLLAPVAASGQLPLPQDSLRFPIPQTIISANLGAIAVDYAGLGIFHALSPNHAVGAIVNYIYRPVGDELARGYAAGVHYRYYPGNRALWRFHYTLALAYQYAYLTYKEQINATGLSGGASVGWQWFPAEGFAVGFEFGEQYVHRLNDQTNGALNKVFGLRPLMAFDLGVAF